MHRSIPLIALLFGHISALPQLAPFQLPIPETIQFPTIEGTALDAQRCNYFNEEQIYTQGFQGVSLIQSGLGQAAGEELSGPPEAPQDTECSAVYPAVARFPTTTAKRAGLELDQCATRGKLTFTNLANAGPWRTPEPEWFLPIKHIVLTWTPGVVVTSVKMYKVAGYGEEHWGVPVLLQRSCQGVDRDPHQSYVVFPPREDQTGFLMFDFIFDSSTLPIDREVEVGLVDAEFKEV
ncbi:MAG: hypothetical protein Q9169_008284 [Polycauliona sp. 2 TL-2023]